MIFETLNERGEPLLAADLIRNNIFQRADANLGPDKAEKLFSAYWKTLDDSFWSQMEKQGRYKKQRIEFFIANFIAGKIAGEITISKLFSEYKAFLRPSKDKTRSRYQTVELELKDLTGYGQIYREFVQRNANSALSQFSSHLHPWDVTTANPLILRLWAADELPEADKKDALDFLLSFIIRRAVCNLTNKNYNNLFLSAIAHLDDVGWSVSEFRSFFLMQKSISGRFPKDEEFTSRLVHTPIYRTLGAARTKALLYEIELQKRGKYQEALKLPDDLSVEHIMPVVWRTRWPMMDETTPSESDFAQAQYWLTEDDSPLGRIASGIPSFRERRDFEVF